MRQPPSGSYVYLLQALPDRIPGRKPLELFCQLRGIRMWKKDAAAIVEVLRKGWGIRTDQLPASILPQDASGLIEHLAPAVTYYQRAKARRDAFLRKLDEMRQQVPTEIRERLKEFDFPDVEFILTPEEYQNVRLKTQPIIEEWIRRSREESNAWIDDLKARLGPRREQRDREREEARREFEELFKRYGFGFGHRLTVPAGNRQKAAEILGVTVTATQDAIKQAFRRLAKQHHPDLGGDPEQFKQLHQAYQALTT